METRNEHGHIMIGRHVDRLSDIRISDGLRADSLRADSLRAVYQILVPGINRSDRPIIDRLRKNKIKIIAHASYNINIAKNWDKYSTHIDQLIEEIKTCGKMRIDHLILHTGKQLDLSKNVALNNMYGALSYVHRKTIKYRNVRIVVETPSGQGTELLTDLTDFCNFMNRLRALEQAADKWRFYMCVDTCHLFAAGYDLRKEKILRDVFRTIRRTYDLNRLAVCHLNDSVYDCGSRVDRHAYPGKGQIGRAMSRIARQMIHRVPYIVIEA